tara:strand:+ start:1259 stop:1363 length:105 start_codon:yes stop_codon:yes gene_type:complete
MSIELFEFFIDDVKYEANVQADVNPQRKWKAYEN